MNNIVSPAKHPQAKKRVDMEYTIVVQVNTGQETTFDRLIEKVKKYIELGWKPLGGVSSWGHYIFQTMIREKQ